MTKPAAFIVCLCLLALNVNGCKSMGAGYYLSRGESAQLNSRADIQGCGSLPAGSSLSACSRGGIMTKAGIGGQAIPAPPSSKSGLSPSKSSASVPAVKGKSEKATYQTGQSLLKQKKYQQAADVFRGMLARYPSGYLAPNARYWLGECHYARGEYIQAAFEFTRCANDYPASPKAPDALLKLSYSYDRLGDGPQAMSALDKLLSRYPKSAAAEIMKSGRGGFQS